MLSAPALATGAVGKITFPGADDLPRTPFDSYTFSAVRPNAGGPVFELSLSGKASKSSPAIFSHGVRGLHIPDAVIDFGDSPLEICVSNAEIVSVEQGTKGSTVRETFELEFQQILMSFDAGVAQIPVAGFDSQANGAWNGPCP
jgi:hypothetical protein